jgi:hypothetical protein
MDDFVTCDVSRRIGVEIELNTPTGEIKPLKKNEAPEGADYVGVLVNKSTAKKTTVHGWHSTHDNTGWVIKPDSSCGIEVCSPIGKGWDHIVSIAQVAEDIRTCGKIGADSRCSLHAHIDAHDLDDRQLASILAYWIKCEAVINDAFPSKRKLNRYCQYIGISDLFDAHEEYSPYEIIRLLSGAKYYSVNTFHLQRGNRRSFEVRYGENEMCTDAFSMKNWLLFVLHFCRCALDAGLPWRPQQGDVQTGLYWFDPVDMFKFLRWDNPDILSPSLRQVRRWYLGRLSEYTIDTGLPGIWSYEARRIAYEQVLDMLGQEKLEPGLYKPTEGELFGKEYLF